MGNFTRFRFTRQSTGTQTRRITSFNCVGKAPRILKHDIRVDEVSSHALARTALLPVLHGP